MKNMIFVLSLALIASAASGYCAETIVGKVEIESRSSENNGHPYDQLLTIQAGPYRPQSIRFTNANNNSFNYDEPSRGSFVAELGWGIQLFRAGGTAFHLSESLSYANFRHKLPTSFAANPGNTSVTFHLFGFDTRLSQSWETCPLASIVPFWEGGVLFSLYSQSGASDLVSAEGSTTNAVAGVGLRFWLNRADSINPTFSNRYNALPVFISAKVNHIFSNGSGVDPANTTVLGGVSVGL